jgi:AdoMet-dependent heme synthase
MSLMESVVQRALALRVPFSVQVDLTYRCNERCEHCYLDHNDRGELNTSELKRILQQLADAGVFFLTLSGGEPFLRRDLFEILQHARSLNFNIKLKTNAILIRPQDAQRLRQLAVEQVQVSVYSTNPGIHDAITKLPGSLMRTIAGIRSLRTAGIKVSLANVLMSSNAQDSESVRQLSTELGTHYTLDPTITPMMDGDTSILKYRVSSEMLRDVFHNPHLVGNPEEFCAAPPPIDDTVLEGYSCSAGHTACYISPYGKVFPCVQFPLSCGNLRQQSFQEIWTQSPQLAEVRSIRAKDLPTCSSCSHLGSCARCPGLAYMEGDIRGPSSADCQKSYIRTGITTAGMLRVPQSSLPPSASELVQIQLPSASGRVSVHAILKL